MAFPEDQYSPGLNPGPGPLMVKPSRAVWVFLMLGGVFGGISLALAINEGFALGRARFASDQWRAVLGGIGGLFLFLTARGIVRTLRGDVIPTDATRRRRGRFLGLIYLVVGGFCLGVTFSDSLADATISFSSWASVFYRIAGFYFVLLALVAQINPSKAISEQRLRAGEGIQGTGRILRASDTGLTVNDAPQVKIEFQIELPDRAPYEASDRIVMERAKLALLIPGSTVDVRVDVGDQEVFHVDWESWRGPAES